MVYIANIQHCQQGVKNKMKLVRKKIKEAINPDDTGEGTPPVQSKLAHVDKSAKEIMDRPTTPEKPDELETSGGKEFMQKMGIEKKPITAPPFRHKMTADDEVRQLYKDYKRIKGIDEEAPANSAGSGNIAGLGVGPQGEPGIRPAARKKYKIRNKKGAQDQETELALFRRKTPMMEEVKRGKFAGHDTFIVPSDMFHKARLSKKKGKHWKTYIGEDEHGFMIREYDRKHKGKKPIILQDEKTGAMCYARYGR